MNNYFFTYSTPTTPAASVAITAGCIQLALNALHHKIPADASKTVYVWGKTPHEITLR